MAEKIFITGTDTDIGKTVVSALLAGYLREQGVSCGYLKLVSCGGDGCGDCAYVQKRAGVPVHNVYHFPLPASPHLAAEQNGQQIDTHRFDEALARMDSQYDLLLIEGAGGLLVPLTRSLLLGDYMAGQDVQSLVVARSGLGTINQTLLTMEGLRQRQMATLGVVFNDAEQFALDDLLVNDNLRTIGDFAGVPVLGRMARFGKWSDGVQAFQPIGRSILALLSQARLKP